MDSDSSRWEARLAEPVVVHQAVGMIIAHLRISSQDAYRALDDYAELLRWPVRAIACEIVARSISLSEAFPSPGAAGAGTGGHVTTGSERI